MNSILVISQESKIFAVFDQVGVETVKVTSAAAAMVLLKDKEINPEFIFIDNSLKSVEDIVKIIIKKNIRYFIIGQEIPKPLKVEHLKQLLINPDLENKSSIVSPMAPKSVEVRLQNIVAEELVLNEKPTLYNFFSNLKSTPKTVKTVQAPKPIMSYFIQQKVVALLRVKGGVGTTLIATHLAKSFSQMRVCIIDLNFSDGGSDLSYFLDLPQVPHWGNFIRNKNKSGFFEALVSRDDIHVLQVPPTAQLIQDIKIDDIVRAINYAQKKFNIIIFDLPRELNELTREALEHATNTYIISAGHQSEVMRIKKIIDLIDQPVLVLNKKGADAKRQFREYLGITEIITIAEDDQLFRCSDKRSFGPEDAPFVQGVAKIKEHILGQGKLNLLQGESGNV